MIVLKKESAKCLITSFTIEFIKEANNLEYYSKIINFQKKFTELRKFIKSTYKKLNVLLFKNNNSTSTINFVNSPYFPPLNQIIEDNKKSPSKYIYSLYYEKIIIVGSIHSIYKIIKRLQHFANKIELDFQKSYITDTIKNYKIVVNQALQFVFLDIAEILFDLTDIKKNIESNDWNVSESAMNAQLFEASSFVNLLINQFKLVYENIPNIESLPDKIKAKLIKTFIDYCLKHVIESLSMVKKCNSTGRSMMLKDLKFLKNSLEEIFKKEWKLKVDITDEFSKAINFINAWYSNADELLKYLFENVIIYII